REVPDRHLGLRGDVDRALGEQAIAPEVAVRPGPPDRSGQVEEAVQPTAFLPARQAGVGQARVLEAGDLGDVAAGGRLEGWGGPTAGAPRPPPPAGWGRRRGE